MPTSDDEAEDTTAGGMKQIIGCSLDFNFDQMD